MSTLYSRTARRNQYYWSSGWGMENGERELRLSILGQRTSRQAKPTMPKAKVITFRIILDKLIIILNILSFYISHPTKFLEALGLENKEVPTNSSGGNIK
jgi:hypothetical protein